MIGRVESRRIKDICEYQMQLSGEKAKYACFIYIERTIYNHDNPSGGTPVKAAVGNAVILLAKDVIYDEYFFDLRQSFFVSVKDLMASGAKGIPETQKYPDVYCWIPLFSINSGVVITPVYKIDPRKWQTFFENMFVFHVDRRMCVRYNCKHKERTNVP